MSVLFLPRLPSSFLLFFSDVFLITWPASDNFIWFSGSYFIYTNCLQYSTSMFVVPGMRSPTNFQHYSVAQHFKTIDFVVLLFNKSKFHIYIILILVFMLLLLLKQNCSLFPDGNLRLVNSVCYFCLTVSCMLYCCSKIFVLLDLCKPLSFYIHVTLFLRCFLYDHVLSSGHSLPYHIVRWLHLAYQSLYSIAVAHSLPV